MLDIGVLTVILVVDTLIVVGLWSYWKRLRNSSSMLHNYWVTKSNALYVIQYYGIPLIGIGLCLKLCIVLGVLAWKITELL